MPTEYRVLHFDKREVLEALRDYRSQMGQQLPRENLQGLNLMQEGEIAIDLKPVGNGPSTTFTDAEVVTALILFCSKKNILIPRKPATKSLGIANDDVSLQIEIGSRTTVLK